MSHGRNPEKTKLRLIEAAFQEIHLHGYQGMRVDTVLDKTGLKKGAFYHHFKSKQELGYAVVDTIIKDMITEMWMKPMQQFDDPIQGMRTIMAHAMDTVVDEFLEYGCPLNNLAQEMSPIDEGFRQRIEVIYQDWTTSIKNSLERGQEKGFIKPDLDTAKVAVFILGALEGCIGIGKNANKKTVFNQCAEGLSDYLQTLYIPSETKS